MRNRIDTALIEKEVNLVAELVITEELPKNVIQERFTSKGMSTATFNRRWRAFKDKSASYYKQKQMGLIGTSIAKKKANIERIEALLENTIESNEIIKISTLLDRLYITYDDFLVKCGIINAVADKLEVSGSMGNVLKVVFPEGFKMPKKDDIK